MNFDNSAFIYSVKTVRQAVAATFVMLSLVTAMIMLIAAPFCYNLVWNAIFDVTMEQSQRQAQKFSNLVNMNIGSDGQPDKAISLIQQILGNSLGNSLDNSEQYICIVDKQGKILAHPDASAVGSYIKAKYLLKDSRWLKNPEVIVVSETFSRNIIRDELSQKKQLLLQMPIDKMDLSIWVHTDVGILDAKADRVMGAIAAVALPSLLLIIVIGTLAVRRVGRSYEHRLEGLAQTDSLTGIANRRHFDERLKYEWQRSARTRNRVSLVMLDIDYFKQYNDHYGHLAGDEVLHQVAECLRKNVRRATDTVARYGGEEFVVILMGCSPHNAARMSKKLLLAVAALDIEHKYSDCAENITCSAGVVSVYPDRKVHEKECLELADQALYRAKSAGRNQLCVAEH